MKTINPEVIDECKNKLIEAYYSGNTDIRSCTAFIDPYDERDAIVVTIPFMGDPIKPTTYAIDILYNETVYSFDCDVYRTELDISNGMQMDRWRLILISTKDTYLKDRVNHPSHYEMVGPFESFDIIVESLGIEGARYFCQGNILKYQTRYKAKNGEEDLKKRHWYSKMDQLLSECETIKEYYEKKNDF